MSNKSAHIKKKLIEALEKSLGVVTIACKEIGISRTTFYDYYKNDPDFKEKVDELNNIALDLAENKLHKAINQENITAIIFYLKTKGKARGYIERQDYGIDVEQPIKINIGKRD